MSGKSASRGNNIVHEEIIVLFGVFPHQTVLFNLYIILRPVVSIRPDPNCSVAKIALEHAVLCKQLYTTRSFTGTPGSFPNPSVVRSPEKAGKVLD